MRACEPESTSARWMGAGAAAGGARAPRGPRAARGAASSMMVFHWPQPGQRPSQPGDSIPALPTDEGAACAAPRQLTSLSGRSSPTAGLLGLVGHEDVGRRLEDLADDQVVALAVQDHRAAPRELARQDLLGQQVFDVALDGPAQRPRAHGWGRSPPRPAAPWPRR